MKSALYTLVVVAVVFVPRVAKAESQVVFRQDGRECLLDYDGNTFVPGQMDTENYRHFVGPTKETYFRVTGLANNENMTPGKIRKSYLEKRGRQDLVYDRTKGRYLVLSGYRGQVIFYTKISLSADNHTICVLDIFYPRGLKQAFDSQVTRMSRSFTAR